MDTALELLKIKLGISTTVRDKYLKAILDGVKQELKEVQGLNLDVENDNSHLMFIVDYAEFRYSSVGANTNQSVAATQPGLPRHLQWRLHNLIISNKKAGDSSE